LYEQGLSFEISFDAVCLSSPKLVKNIHREYIEAGADIIETNSFGANRFRLEKHALSEKAHLINRTAAQLARQAREEMGRDVYVAGSIGPTGRRLFPLGPTGEDEIRDAFTAQVEGLLEGGIDIFMLETFADLNEINLALEAVRRQSDLPIVAQMSFNTELVTQTGKIPEDCVRFFADKQVTAFGANCSVGPQIMVEIIKRMSSMTSRPLTAQPNASLPKYIGGRYIYNVSPDYFAETMRELFDYGVGLVGGCCGTTPAHIQKLSQLVRQKKEKTPPSDSMPTIGKIDEPVVRERQLTVESSAFEQALRRKFVVSVELDPPRGSNPEKILKAAEKLAAIGVDAVNIADSPMARVRMAALAAAGLIKQNTELELILHMTGRDRNLMGLQSDLLGAYALGVRNILAVTGDPPAGGDYPNVTAVYDVDSIGLLKIIEALNRGEDIGGNSIGYPTALCTGVAVNPGAENYHRELERFRTKESLNACFAMTQPLYRRESSCPLHAPRSARDRDHRKDNSTNGKSGGIIGCGRNRNDPRVDRRNQKSGLGDIFYAFFRTVQHDNRYHQAIGPDRRENRQCRTPDSFGIIINITACRNRMSCQRFFNGWKRPPRYSAECLPDRDD
jgi:homocysteine S-methyltransferase